MTYNLLKRIIPKYSCPTIVSTAGNASIKWFVNVASGVTPTDCWLNFCRQSEDEGLATLS